MIDSTMTLTSAQTRAYHVTVLSNFALAYDRYSRRYDKTALPACTFPDRFFLLDHTELGIGIDKASTLLHKLGLDGDRLIALETEVETRDLHPNRRTGLGRYVARPWIRLSGVFWIDDSGRLSPERIEEVAARSLELRRVEHDFAALRPRSVSLLPVARGCQAACPFCFSHASISAEQDQAGLDPRRVEHVLDEAARQGAERAVITGGGEPTLIDLESLLWMIEACRKRFAKVVLISNGYAWARHNEQERLDILRRAQAAGLTVLALSRHHHDAGRNADIMGLDTGSERLASTWHRHAEQFPSLSLRWVCVLQQGGIADQDGIEAYVRWAAFTGVGEVCFKELYVSTSVESVYHSFEANDWSHERQVPLSRVLRYAETHGWRRTGALPWGSPIFSGGVDGHAMRIAAYTEPSLLWELDQGLCRSWNLMADGRCFASLESRHSEVCPE